MQREFPSDFDPEIETQTFRKEDDEWFRNALREADDTYIINIPLGLTLEKSHKIAKEVKKEKAKERVMRQSEKAFFETPRTKEEFDESAALRIPLQFNDGLDKVEEKWLRMCENQKTEDKKRTMRQFDTGATRDTDLNKLDYEGFFSPLVLKCCAEYLNEHRVQANGKLRDSDNWQQGIPIKVYMKSKWRHFMDTWMIFRGYGPVYDIKDNHIITMEEALCGEIFNASGHLHEILKAKLEPQEPQPETIPGVESNVAGYCPDYS